MKERGMTQKMLAQATGIAQPNLYKYIKLGNATLSSLDLFIKVFGLDGREYLLL